MIMTAEVLVVFIGLILVFIGLVFGIYRRFPFIVRRNKTASQWRHLRRMLANSSRWPGAIIGADELLNNALKKVKPSGESMGERMVESQDKFTDNDGVWKAHKLANSLREEREAGGNQIADLSEVQVREAMVSFGKALKDLGAL